MAGRALVLLFSLLAFATILHFVYQVKIAPDFSYLGYRYRSPNPAAYMASLSMVFVVGLLLPKRLRIPSDVVLWIMFIMACVPSALVPQYADILSPGESVELAVVVSVSFGLVVLLAHRGPRRITPRALVSPTMLWVGVGIVSAGVYVLMFYTTGLTLRYISLTDIRDVRFDYRTTVAESSALLPYLLGLQANVINPLVIAKGVYSRRWLLTLLGALGQVSIYSVTGYKLIILSVPAILLVSWMFRVFKQNMAITLLYGVVATSLASLIADWLEGGRVFATIFINRLALVPGTLAAAHVLVFRDRPKAEWGYTFMAPFVDYPYDVTPAFLVGAVFSGSPRTSANANFFGDGYANLGYLGIFIEAAFLILILWSINYAGAHLPIAVSTAILLVPSLALVNSSVFRSVLTSGFGAAAILMLLLPMTGWGSFGASDGIRPQGGSGVAGRGRRTSNGLRKPSARVQGRPPAKD